MVLPHAGLVITTLCCVHVASCYHLVVAQTEGNENDEQIGAAVRLPVDLDGAFPTPAVYRRSVTDFIYFFRSNVVLGPYVILLVRGKVDISDKEHVSLNFQGLPVMRSQRSYMSHHITGVQSWSRHVPTPGLKMLKYAQLVFLVTLLRKQRPQV
ncbi:MAG: hypothetical protein JW395_2889 [Nitrospira sp.]|nr:hypothetical protein [Nitrospira sp.]